MAYNNHPSSNPNYGNSDLNAHAAPNAGGGLAGMSSNLPQQHFIHQQPQQQNTDREKLDQVQYNVVGLQISVDMIMGKLDTLMGFTSLATGQVATQDLVQLVKERMTKTEEEVAKLGQTVDRMNKAMNILFDSKTETERRLQEIGQEVRG